MKNLFAQLLRKPAQPAAEPVRALEPAKPVAEPIAPVRRPAAVARAIKPAWHAPAAPFPQKPRTPALADRALPTEMVTLRLGDFLDHLPSELLETGSPDRSIPMPFELSSLSERIGRGDAMIRLTEVYRRMPDIFRSDAAINPDRTIPFPWKKVLAMIQEAKKGAADGGISPTGVEALAQKFKARKQRQPTKTAPKPYAANETTKEAAPDSAPEGAMSVAPATSGLRIVAPTVKIDDAATARVLTQLRAERDAALARAAEFGAEYDASIGRTGELTAERDTALARAAELTASHDAAVAQAAAMTTERDAATARIAELAAEHAAATARIEKLVADSESATAQASEKTACNATTAAREAELTAARAAATARAVELTAERDAALACAAEPAAERDAALARVTALTAERDAAAARAEKLIADSDTALALGTEAIAERDTLATRLTALTGERDAALSRLAEVTAERDALAARPVEILPAVETAAPTDAPHPAAAAPDVVIEGYKNTIEALLRERDALRQSHGLPVENSAAPKASAAGHDAAAHEPLPDAYSELFPTRRWFRQAAAAAALALLGAAIVSQMPLGPATPAAPASPAPAESEFSTPVQSEVTMPDSELQLESKPLKETLPLPAATDALLN